jgi:poly-gamma-glutamate capsule biosynthesis protein CapA/YwtB (metallophosphatase superfamily)
MPDKETIRRARRDAAQGKSPSTQAGEFVREEIHHVREGKHGARSPKQAIAIGLSKARRAGVKLPAPSAGKTSTGIRRRAKRDLSRSRSSSRPSARRARAAKSALRRERRSSVSRPALARQARAAARRRKSR